MSMVEAVRYVNNRAVPSPALLCCPPYVFLTTLQSTMLLVPEPVLAAFCFWPAARFRSGGAVRKRLRETPVGRPELALDRPAQRQRPGLGDMQGL